MSLYTVQLWRSVLRNFCRKTITLQWLYNPNNTNLIAGMWMELIFQQSHKKRFTGHISGLTCRQNAPPINAAPRMMDLPFSALYALMASSLQDIWTKNTTDSGSSSEKVQSSLTTDMWMWDSWELKDVLHLPVAKVYSCGEPMSKNVMKHPGGDWFEEHRGEFPIHNSLMFQV